MSDSNAANIPRLCSFPLFSPRTATNNIVGCIKQHKSNINILVCIKRTKCLIPMLLTSHDFVLFLCSRREQRQRTISWAVSNNTRATLKKTGLYQKNKTMVAVIHTSLQVITVGLGLAGFDISRSRDPESALNQRRFRSFYGSSHGAIADLWEDLMITPIDQARIDLDDDCLETFFVAMFFLRNYTSEHIMSGLYKHSETAVRGYWRYYCAKVQALKDQVIVWPKDWNDQEKELFLFTVDGVHCRIRERGHPTLYRDPAIYSHKFHQAAFVYELAISIREPRLVHIAGPFDASVGDLTIFQEAGLMDKVPPGKRGIADSAYSSEKEV
jgi:hypothetical protein